MNNTNLLSRIGRAAVLAFIGALGLFSAELAGLLPELQGLNTIIVTGLIGLVSFAVERLRDLVNMKEGFAAYSIEDVTLMARLLRSLAVALLGGGAIFLSDVGGFIPDLPAFTQIVITFLVGSLSLGLEVLRDRFELSD